MTDVQQHLNFKRREIDLIRLSHESNKDVSNVSWGFINVDGNAKNIEKRNTRKMSIQARSQPVNDTGKTELARHAD